MNGEDYLRTDFGGAVALVIGNEGKGISRLVREKCDVIVSLPLKGRINSLNASVAAGILMYKVAEKR
jgi:23S rRNA (guanosine2251-2'-O)-methyltransferase